MCIYICIYIYMYVGDVWWCFGWFDDPRLIHQSGSTPRSTPRATRILGIWWSVVDLWRFNIYCLISSNLPWGKLWETNIDVKETLWFPYGFPGWLRWSSRVSRALPSSSSHRASWKSLSKMHRGRRNELETSETPETSVGAEHTVKIWMERGGWLLKLQTVSTNIWWSFEVSVK